ncbi:MAG: Unknown protein [uncultured Sulfurovum sp.]|uniref:MOSC domain-containing protein n=1 Tax=uncultured Sulfurovum sp. TaxID=269237 RepID=A0A6S6TKG9_9BACT|nr:MAG: Unknown protein [uncultured Sulfurovum sp.]
MSNSIGHVVELFISKKNEDQRISKTLIEIDMDGVIDDKFYAKDVERAILLTSTSSYDLVSKNNIKISYGALGENILIDYNPYDLPIGTKVKIGKVVIEISQNCTICNHLSSIDKRVPTLLENDRGVFVKVIEAGFIEKGDKLYLLDFLQN